MNNDILSERARSICMFMNGTICVDLEEMSTFFKCTITDFVVLRKKSPISLLASLSIASHATAWVNFRNELNSYQLLYPFEFTEVKTDSSWIFNR